MISGAANIAPFTNKLPALLFAAGFSSPRLERLRSLIIVKTLHSTGVGVPLPPPERFERILLRPFKCIDRRDFGGDHLRGPMRDGRNILYAGMLPPLRGSAEIFHNGRYRIRSRRLPPLRNASRRRPPTCSPKSSSPNRLCSIVAQDRGFVLVAGNGFSLPAPASPNDTRRLSCLSPASLRISSAHFDLLAAWYSAS